MGLDMYLSRKKYIGANYEHRNIKGTIYITGGKDNKEIPVEFNKVSYIEESVGYWRKANAIHKWFVDKVQEGVDDCKQYYVSTEDLQELLDICKKIKKECKLVNGKVKNGQQLVDGEWKDIIEEGKVMTNIEVAEELLPTKSGCFFGSLDYDQWYMQDIEYTIKILNKILKEEKEYNSNGIWCDYYYQSSW